MMGLATRPMSDTQTPYRGPSADHNFRLGAIPAGVVSTRSTTATTVCPNRLGAELVTNGDFSSGAGWSFGAGWAISGGTANAAASSASLYQAALTVGTQVRLTFTVSAYTSGSVRVYIGGGSPQASISAAGTYTFVAVVATDGFLYIEGTGFTGSIDNVSAKVQTLNDPADPISLVTVPAGVPRLLWANSDSYGGAYECKGLVNEPAATNFAAYSERFDNPAAWSFGNISAAPNTALAPDGSLTANTLTASAGSGYHYALQIIAASAGATYTISAFVKAGTVRYVNFGDGGDSVWHSAVLDTQTGLITSQANCTASVEQIAGYFRVRCTFVRINAAFIQAYVAPDISSASVSAPYFVAAGTETCFVWGIQLETGPVATSYIPTTTAAVTRAADALTVPTGCAGAGESTMALEMNLKKFPASYEYYLYSVGGAPGFYVDAGLIWSASCDFAVLAYASRPPSVPCRLKFAASYKNNASLIAKDGVLGTPYDTFLSIMPATLRLGGNGTGEVPNNVIERLRIWPRTMTDAELIAETT